MSDEKTDIEVVQDFLKCTPERAKDMIKRGINVEFLRNKGASLFDETVKEAQTNFLKKITEIKDNLDSRD